MSGNFAGYSVEVPLLNPTWLQIRRYKDGSVESAFVLSGRGEIEALRNELTRELRRRRRMGVD